MSDDIKEKLLSTTTSMPVQNYEEEDDGLSSFSLEQLGQKVSAFGGARLLKFVSGNYVTREGETIDSKREFTLLGLVKVVQKFVGKKLVDTIIVPTWEKFPDIDAMNEAAPREEWGEYNGKPQGPYTRVLVLKLYDERTLDRYAFVTSTIGGSIAFGDISDKIKLIRRIKGANVTAAITCESGVRMKSQHNPHGVPRPHFRVVRYVRLGSDDGDDGGGGKAAPKPLPPSTPDTQPTRPSMSAADKLDAFAGKSDALATAPAASILDLPTVLQPTLKEEMADDLPF